MLTAVARVAEMLETSGLFILIDIVAARHVEELASRRHILE
jgi:hypothetical protein